METVKARVTQAPVDGQQKTFISIELESITVCIPMCEDKPNEVKAAFNRIISRIRAGEFQIQLEGVGEDLSSSVAKEYIVQLNREITEVHGEMKRYGLLESEETSGPIDSEAVEGAAAAKAPPDVLR